MSSTDYDGFDPADPKARALPQSRCATTRAGQKPPPRAQPPIPPRMSSRSWRTSSSARPTRHGTSASDCASSRRHAAAANPGRHPKPPSKAAPVDDDGVERTWDEGHGCWLNSTGCEHDVEAAARRSWRLVAHSSRLRRRLFTRLSLGCVATVLVPWRRTFASAPDRCPKACPLSYSYVQTALCARVCMQYHLNSADLGGATTRGE